MEAALTTRALRLASYNIRKSVGLDSRRDPGRILDVLNGLDADVIALQEADKRLGDRPSSIDRQDIEITTDFEVADLAKNGVSLGWHGNAILVRKGLTIQSVAHISLPGLEPRGAVEVRLHHGKNLLKVVGVHLGLLRSYRRAQLQRIKEHVTLGDLGTTVVLGDFNEWSTEDGLEPIQGDFKVVSPGKSFHSAWPFAALDRFALGERIKLLDAGVEQEASAKIASDHLPIWADIALSPADHDIGT